MTTTVYKLVLSTLRDKDDPYSQVYKSLVEGGYAMEYNLKYPTHAPIPRSFLYAFSTLNAAEAYTKGSNDILSKEAVLRILKCAADVVGGPAYHTLENTEKFWEERWWEFEDEWPYVVECGPEVVWCSTIIPIGAGALDRWAQLEGTEERTTGDLPHKI